MRRFDPPQALPLPPPKGAPGSKQTEKCPLKGETNPGSTLDVNHFDYVRRPAFFTWTLKLPFKKVEITNHHFGLQ